MRRTGTALVLAFGLFSACDAPVDQPAVRPSVVKKTAPVPRPWRAACPHSHRIPKKERAFLAAIRGSERVRDRDRVDVLSTFEDRELKVPITVTLVQNVIVLGRAPDGRLSLAVVPAEAELLALAGHVGTLQASRRSPKDRSVLEDRRFTSTATLMGDPDPDRGARLRWEGFQKALRGAPATVPRGAREVTLRVRGAALARAGDHVDVLFTGTDPLTRQTVTMTLLSDVVLSARLAAPERVALLVHPTEVERLVHASRVGVLHASLRRPGDPDHSPTLVRVTRHVLKTGEAPRVAPPHRFDTIQRIRILRGVPSPKQRPRPRPRPRPRLQPRPRPRPRRPVER